MELERKPDFDRALARFEAWWDRQILDRPPVTVTVRPEQPPRLPEKHHADLRTRWLDVEYAVDCAEAEAAAGIYLAETFPRYEPSVGPEVASTVFGCDLEFTPRTSYSKPIAASCRDVLALRPNLDTPYWQNIRAKTDLSLERGRGRWITAMPDLHTNGDLVASLRDPLNLCYDLADDAQAVRAACDHVTTAGYTLMFQDIWRRIAAAGQPCTNWTPVLHAGPMYTVACDFIGLISTPMFCNAILPSIRREMTHLDRRLFHVDGAGALRHLDALLERPEIEAIQWVYGAGHGPAAKWIDVYKRIQAAGKGLQLIAESLDDARATASHLRPEGVWLFVEGEVGRDEAEAFIRWAERWAAHAH